MKRLTKKGYNFSENDIYSSIDNWSLAQCLNRLREYEDTGLEPEEIVKLNSFTDNQAVKLLEKYQHEAEKRRWIPVKERLPEGKTNVICQFDNDDIELLWQDWESDPETLTYSADFDMMAEKKVIAWMPLPEPYKAN